MRFHMSSLRKQRCFHLSHAVATVDTMNTSEPFNRRLRRLMRDRGLESKELASLSGLSPSYIRVLLSESGRTPSMNKVTDIASALKVSVGELVGGDEEAARLRELREQAEAYEAARLAYQIQRNAPDLFYGLIYRILIDPCVTRASDDLLD